MMLRSALLLPLGVIAIAAPLPSQAEWTVVAANPDYFVEFDPDTLRRQGPYMMAWTRLTFTTQQRSAEVDSKKFQSQLQLHAVDCTQTASTVVGLIVYTGALGHGDVVERSTRPRPQWAPKAAPPGSLHDMTIRLACNSKPTVARATAAAPKGPGAGRGATGTQNGPVTGRGPTGAAKKSTAKSR